MSLEVEKNPCQVSVSGPELVQSGETVHLQCSVSAACEDRPEWAWSESAQLPSSSYSQDGKTAKLSFPALWSHDGVTFTCSPSRSKDACVSRSIKLTVRYSPITTADSYDPSIKEGHAVTFTCHSKGNPQPTFRWFKVGRGETTQEREWTLNSVTAEDAGRYFCQAANDLGVKNSTVVTLDVIYAPKGVSVWTGKALDSVREGERISFTCKVQSSNPPASYSWYKDWSQLGCTDRELNLTDIKLQDTGNYYCRATNPVGYKDSPHVQITVLYGPRDTRIVASEGGVKVGRNLTLTCHAEALPEPNRYTWFHALPLTGGWTEVPAPSNRPSDRRALSWEQIRVSDAGEYMCQAGNEISAKNFHLAPRRCAVWAHRPHPAHGCHGEGVQPRHHPMHGGEQPPVLAQPNLGPCRQAPPWPPPGPKSLPVETPRPVSAYQSQLLLQRVCQRRGPVHLPGRQRRGPG
ncbi:hypothetical protein COCON_G00002320 [Conger conger]|uniref:Ig-like domain-containing protein n=1 Tax=Conger conger TaxID=82655 RepID=A0A9Q1E0W9_CONCO|nr:hypothetical protein COCON_G00002320 [Conger conger]